MSVVLSGDRIFTPSERRGRCPAMRVCVCQVLSGGRLMHRISTTADLDGLDVRHDARSALSPSCPVDIHKH